MSPRRILIVEDQREVNLTPISGEFCQYTRANTYNTQV
jgi:hypothetical protein